MGISGLRVILLRSEFVLGWDCSCPKVPVVHSDHRGNEEGSMDLDMNLYISVPG